MGEMVQCVKTGREGEKLDRQPFPNDLGKRIYENVSKEGWALWIAHSTMLINEYRLELDKAQHREFLLKQCEDFFFGDGSAPPPDYKPDADAG
jgi:Fe-S cluster biosynthesis and repair protein YggX